MNQVEKMIGEMCYQNAKNKDEAAKYLGAYKQNRYQKMKQNKKDDYFKKLRHNEKRFSDGDELTMKK